jgi:sterol 3beta-glucosyltransferase
MPRTLRSPIRRTDRPALRLLAITCGTEGDTRPIAVLCRALIDAGHEVRLLADRSTLDTADALGIPAQPLGGDIRHGDGGRAERENRDRQHGPDASGSDASGSDASGSGASGPDETGTDATGTATGTIGSVIAQAGRPNAALRALADIANPQAAGWLRDALAAGRGCDALVVSGLTAFVGLSAAEKLRVPAIGAAMIPITPTRTFPSPFVSWRVPHPLNRLSHDLVNGLMWRAFRGRTNEARAEVAALPGRRRQWTDQPMLYGISPSLLPRPDDWPSNAVICGQWVLPTPRWAPPSALADFLRAGEPPLYVGFGSAAGFDAPRLLEAVVRAVAGRRALYFPGWSGLDGSRLPSNFHVLGETPHGWLFPQTAAVIHHGGSGTSHSAARAGVPSIVVPFAGDQFFWCDRLQRAGVAPAHVDARRPDATQIGRAIQWTSDPTVRHRARRLGERMASEDGVSRALEAIESIVAAGVARL